MIQFPADPCFSKKEVLVARGFGRIHGLVFSISLSGMELGWKSKLISILGFNLGIEAMQLIIMLCFLPLLLSSRWKFYHGLRTAFGLMTIVLSCAGWPNGSGKKRISSRLI